MTVLCSTECLRLSLRNFIIFGSSNLIFVNNAQEMKYQPGKLIYNCSQPSGHYMYHQFNIHNTMFFPHRVVTCFV